MVQIWNNFSVCPACERLCELSSTSKCRRCSNIYQNTRNARRKSGGDPTKFNQLMKESVTRMSMYGSLDMCGWCDEYLRGTKRDYVGQTQVCPYCFAMHKRGLELTEDALDLLIDSIRHEREVAKRGRESAEFQKRERERMLAKTPEQRAREDEDADSFMAGFNGWDDPNWIAHKAGTLSKETEDLKAALGITDEEFTFGTPMGPPVK